MEQLPVGTLVTIISILGTVLLTLFSVISYFLKDIRSSVKEKQNSQDKNIQEIERDFSEFKAELPQRYVLKDDFNRSLKELKDDQTRAIAGLEHKVDTLTRDVREMIASVSKLTGAGGKNE